MKPIIGIVGDVIPDEANPRSGGAYVKLNWNYSKAVAEAGGIPFIVPPVADPRAVIEIVDGLLIPGGDDIDAARFGEANHPKAELQHPARFEIEEKLYKAAPAEMPVLGICYGCQFLNVAQGGSLIQHLPDVEGSEIHTGGPRQSYRLEQGKLSTAFGSNEVAGLSYHHQAVGRVGEGVKVVGRHADGTVEALEVEDRIWTVGVQWHPERSLEDPAMRSLFAAFVQQAIVYREGRSLAAV